jgi:hypothetical protein
VPFQSRVKLEQGSIVGRQFQFELSVVRARGMRRIIIKRREEDGHTRRAGRAKHAARRFDDRVETATNLMAFVQPIAREVDHNHSRTLAEPNSATPASTPISLAQRIEMREQMPTQAVRQPQIV